MWHLAMDEATHKWVQRVAKLSENDWIPAFGYKLFLVTFIVSAVVMVAAVFIPKNLPFEARTLLARLSQNRGRILVFSGVTLFFLCAVSQQLEIDHRRGYLADENRIYEKKVRSARTKEEREAILKAEYLYIPQGNTLKYMSLGNTSLAADYLWLTSTQYVSRTFKRGERFKLLSQFYDNILELDPHWTESQVNAGRTLSALHPERYDVEGYYMKAIQKNPDAWLLNFEAGRLFIFPPENRKLKKDFAGRAVFWFKRTLEKLERMPSTPALEQNIKLVKSLLSQMALDSGQLEISDSMAFSIAINKENPHPLRVSSAQEWLMSRSLLIESKLQEAVNKIKQTSGNFPPTLEPAFQMLKPDTRIAPRDTFGFLFFYDPATGLVKSQGVLARHTLQAHAILAGHITSFKAAQSRWPKNMAELHSFMKKQYSPPNEKAGAAITNWIGEELNTETTPLGRPWEYNAETGELKLPEGLYPQMIYDKVKEHFPDIYSE